MLSTTSLRVQTAAFARPANTSARAGRLTRSVLQQDRPPKAPNTVVSIRRPLQVRAIGNVNDPEKTKKEKERKKNDSVWAEPSNNNPLEKTSLMRGDPGKAADGEDELDLPNPLEGAKKAADNIKEKAKEILPSDKK